MPSVESAVRHPTLLAIGIRLAISALAHLASDVGEIDWLSLGLISLPAGIAIMLGAEIGTCADTLLATIGRSRAAVKAGVFHLLFNIVSVTVGVLLIAPLARFGAATASDTGQQIANAHVLFNVAGALLALPFVGAAARLLDRLAPERRGGGVAAEAA